MNETTSVTINGLRTDLLFGARYRVRYGRADNIIEDGELLRRERNGDLLFRLPRAQGLREVRVRPSTIDAIFGSGTEEDAPAGPVVAPVRQTKRQRAAVAEELTERAAVEDLIAETDAVLRAAGREDLTITPAPKRARATFTYAPRDPETGLLVGDHELPDTYVNPAYRTHHFAWRCPTCKRRSRAAFCKDGHEPLLAPVGFRAQDRTPNHGRAES